MNQIAYKTYLKQWRKAHPNYNKEWLAAHPGYMTDQHEAYRKVNPDYDAGNARRFRLANPGVHSQRVKAYAEANPEKVKCHSKINQAIKQGKITRLPCQVCGEIRSHAHHNDYAKPFEIEWLCATHHKIKHRKAGLVTSTIKR